jgi:hypothetical protein
MNKCEGGSMRTAIMIVCGLLAWGACLAAAKLLFGSGAATLSAASIVFILAWFAVAAINTWLGVSRAGYSFGEELPIFLLIFAMPALIAVVVGWKWFGALTRG